MRDLMKHTQYLVFWGSIALVFLAVNIGVLWKLHQIVQLLKNR